MGSANFHEIRSSEATAWQTRSWLVNQDLNHNYQLAGLPEVHGSRGGCMGVTKSSRMR